MKTFEQMIGMTGTEALNARVKNVMRNTSAASRAKVEAVKQEFRDLQSRLFDHTDLAVKDQNSLSVELKDPSKWTDELYQIIMDMTLKAAEVRIIVNTHNKLFPDNSVEGLDSEDLELITEVSAKE